MSLVLRGCAAALATAMIACPAAAADAAHGHGAHAEGKPPASTFQRAMDAGMAKMMADMHAAGYSGDPDVDFLAMMVPHHEGAVEMARLLLIHGSDPATRRLAEDIIASQQVEIDSMRRRLVELRSGKAAQPDSFPALGGTRGTAPAR